MSGVRPQSRPWRRCSARAASTQLHEQRLQARPRDRPRLRHQLAQAWSEDELGHEVDEVALFAVVADLDDRGVPQLQRPRLAEEPRADTVPVALAARPEHPDRHRMAERAVHAAKHLAAEAARADPLLDVVRREQRRGRRLGGSLPAGRRRRRSPRRSPPWSATNPRVASRARARRPHPPRPGGPRETGSGAARLEDRCAVRTSTASGPVEGQPSGQHLEDDNAETVHIGLLVDRRGRSTAPATRNAIVPMNWSAPGQPRLVRRLAEVGDPEVDDFCRPAPRHAKSWRTMLAGFRSRWTMPWPCARWQRAAQRRNDAPGRRPRPAGRARRFLVLDARAVQELHDEKTARAFESRSKSRIPTMLG